MQYINFDLGLSQATCSSHDLRVIVAGFWNMFQNLAPFFELYVTVLGKLWGMLFTQSNPCRMDDVSKLHATVISQSCAVYWFGLKKAKQSTHLFPWSIISTSFSFHGERFTSTSLSITKTKVLSYMDGFSHTEPAPLATGSIPSLCGGFLSIPLRTSSKIQLIVREGSGEGGVVEWEAEPRSREETITNDQRQARTNGAKCAARFPMGLESRDGKQRPLADLPKTSKHSWSCSSHCTTATFNNAL